MAEFIKREVEYKQQRPGGEEITRTISGINPEAADSTVGAFVGEIANLSANTLTAITNVKYENIPVTFDTLSAVNVVNANENVTLRGSESDDYFYNSGDNVSIKTGKWSSENDTVSNSGTNVTINSKSGHGSFSNTGNYVSMSGGNSVSNSGNNVSIYGAYDNDFISNMGDNVSINGGAGNDSIYNSGSNVSIYGDSGYDSIYNSGANATIYGGSGNDSIYNTGAGVSIYGGSGYDSIYNTGAGVSIYGGLDNDSIYNSGDNVSVYSSAGNDYISLNSAAATLQCSISPNHNVTIQGFNSANHLISLSSDAVFSHTVNADYTQLNVQQTTSTVSSNLFLYGVTSGSLRIQPGNGEVTLYNLDGNEGD